MGILGMLFSGPAERHENTGMEPFSNVENRDDFYAAEWAELITKARARGVAVDFVTKGEATGIKMSYGKSEGLFRDAQGGLKLAEQFLAGL